MTHFAHYNRFNSSKGISKYNRNPYKSEQLQRESEQQKKNVAEEDTRTTYPEDYHDQSGMTSFTSEYSDFDQQESYPTDDDYAGYL